MIVSHEYKYVFVELPFTGTSSISRALRRHGRGVRVLHKHATYNEFYRAASPEERKYFVFSCIRNPLDVAVSHYSKYKNGLHGKFDRMKGGGRLMRMVNSYRLKRFDFVKSTSADFSNYFLRFYKLPYDNWSVVSHPYCDFIIRFENLEADFANALSLIGIEEDIRLPVKNQTAGKSKDFASYYNAEAIERAKRVFGPFMRKWNYEFPAEWGDTASDWRAQKGQELANLFRKPYWLYLKPFAGRWARVERTDNEA